MDGIAIHYSVTEMPSDHARCISVTRGIEQYHQSIGYRAPLAYNFLICSHGEITSGRGWGTTSGANGTAELNLRYWAVCGMLGPEHTPPPAMLATIARLCDEAPNTPRNVVCHSDLHSTSCPGDALRAWVRAGAVAPGGTPGGGGAVPTTSNMEDLMRLVKNADSGEWFLFHPLGFTQAPPEGLVNDLVWRAKVPVGEVSGAAMVQLVTEVLTVRDEFARIVAASVPAGGGGGVSDAQVHAAVRAELDRTRLTG